MTFYAQPPPTSGWHIVHLSLLSQFLLTFVIIYISIIIVVVVWRCFYCCCRIAIVKYILVFLDFSLSLSVYLSVVFFLFSVCIQFLTFSFVISLFIVFCCSSFPLRFYTDLTVILLIFWQRLFCTPYTEEISYVKCHKHSRGFFTWKPVITEWRVIETSKIWRGVSRWPNVEPEWLNCSTFIRFRLRWS